MPEKRSSTKTASVGQARCMNTHILPEDGLHNTSEAHWFFQVALAAEPNDVQRPTLLDVMGRSLPVCGPNGWSLA